MTAWGEDYEWLLEIYKGREHKSPALRNRMVPEADEVIYWEAFAFLSTYRRYKTGPEGESRPLPFTLDDVKTYCEFVEITDVSMKLEFAEMIMALDLEWFALQREKSKTTNG